MAPGREPERPSGAHRQARRVAAGGVGVALAGAGGLTVWGVVDRRTRDLDFFATSPQAVAALLPALEDALRGVGMRVDRQRVTEGFVRLGVRSGDETCEVDLGYDARLFPAHDTELGRVLALEELAADKVLALFGRAQPRDFLDVDALVVRFGYDRLLELAAAKDAGFDRAAFVEALGSFRRLRREDFGLDESSFLALAGRVSAWRDKLQAELDERRDGAWPAPP